MIGIGIIAIIIAYLLGSIPSAHIVTRLATGKDIRKLGSGNVGGRNVYREVGLAAAIPVVIFDVGKGSAAVTIAHWLLGAPPLFVLLAGVAVVAGHMWSIYLKFTGGNGLATTIGVLSVLMTKELLIALAITLLLIVITRNPVLSINTSLLSVPVSAWFLENSGLAVLFSAVILLMMALHFLPTARAAVAKAGSKEKLLDELFSRDKAE